ncbi:MAG TPA: hypothetical protein VNP72_03060, partial [Longimicrobium sp.]|nr:hypothetical protein [Longimicrobium sp.]
MYNEAVLDAPTAVFELTDARREQFIRRTYGHLLAAILGFTAIEVVLFQTGAALQIFVAVMQFSWLMILGGFMLLGWLFSSM